MTAETTKTTAASVHVPGAPDIQGLTFRLFKGEEDYPAMVAVSDRSREADRIEEVDTVESLARSFANTKNFDLHRDVVLAEVGDKLVGYRQTEWWEELDGTRIYHHFGFMAPEWRGRGLEKALVHHCERHLIETARDHPQGRRCFDTWVADTETDL